MPVELSPKVAVLGSGPSGCYLSQALLREMPSAQITVFDRLVSPFGLIRYGVAADHQHTKAITRQFERLFESPQVQFCGNVSIGEHVALEELARQFDVVVLATGLNADRSLDIPGENLNGVFRAGALIRALNSHPRESPALPDLGSDIVLIGGGNVTVDLLRFFVKDRASYIGSDIADELLDSYLAAPAQRITVVSRAQAEHTKSDPKMLKELADLPRARYSSPDLSDPLAPAEDRTREARRQAINSLVDQKRPDYSGPEVSLRFGLRPVRFLGESSIEGVEFESSDSRIVVPATSVITAVGFSAGSDLLSEFTQNPEVTGRIRPPYYRTGWAKRGSQGAIPENRTCAKEVSVEIVEDLISGVLPIDQNKLGVAGLPADVRERSVDYGGWQTLDSHERAMAVGDRVRKKLSDHDQMVAIALGKQDPQ